MCLSACVSNAGNFYGSVLGTDWRTENLIGHLTRLLCSSESLSLLFFLSSLHLGKCVTCFKWCVSCCHSALAAPFFKPGWGGESEEEEKEERASTGLPVSGTEQTLFPSQLLLTVTSESGRWWLMLPHNSQVQLLQLTTHGRSKGIRTLSQWESCQGRGTSWGWSWDGG